MSGLFVQKEEVLRRLIVRWVCLVKYRYFAIYRAWTLWGVVGAIFYGVWLLSSVGWRRYNSWTMSGSNLSWFKDVRIILIGILGYSVMKLGILGYSNLVYAYFTDPILSDKGYMGYAVVVSCSLVWLCQLCLCLYSDSYRELLGKYWERVLMMNVVVLILLLSLFAHAGRAKFGIRVWYHTDRTYDYRSSLDFF